MYVAAMSEREETAGEAYERLRGTFGRLAGTTLDCEVPVVASVNGDAVGAGLPVVAAFLEGRRPEVTHQWDSSEVAAPPPGHGR